MKKFLSFFLVLCMLITAVPALLLPVFAEEGDEVAANKIFSYADAYPNFTKTESEKYFKEAGYADDAAYKAWLELPETFAVDFGDYGWNAGEFDPATGEFEPFARLAFYCDDMGPEAHDLTWITTDTAYKAALDGYIADANAHDGEGMYNIWTNGTPLMGWNCYTSIGNTNAAMTAAYEYTVEETGCYIPFFQSNIINPNVPHKLAIFVGDTLIWPLSATATNYDSWYALSVGETSADKVNATIAETLGAVQLLAGEKMYFAVQGDNMTVDFIPALEQTSQEGTPIIAKTGVDIAKDFTLNVYVDVLGAAEDTAVHMEYWNARPTADQLAAGGTDMGAAVVEDALYKFAYTGLTAKQMTDVIYVRSYTTNAAGEKSYGVVIPASIKAYAMAAMGQDEALDNLLIAMLNYGANAQSIFDYEASELANAGLTEEQKRMSADMSALVDVYANDADGANKIKNVSLIMGTDVGMKYMIDSVEGATTYELEVSKDASFSESTKIAMEAAWEGKEQKAIYNISFAELGDTFYVRAVVDGEAGATLTYSVESYVLRISEECSDNMYFAVASLACLGQMIKAYTA